MRVRLTLDQDAHEFAAYYARVRGLNISAAIGELIRTAQFAPVPTADIRIGPNGLPMLPPTGRTITVEMVNKMDDEEYDPKRFR